MQTEKEVLEFWEKNNIFEKTIQGKKDYIFYDGPPFATGLPHYGHLVASTLKDVVPVTGRKMVLKLNALGVGLSWFTD